MVVAWLRWRVSGLLAAAVLSVLTPIALQAQPQQPPTATDQVRRRSVAFADAEIALVADEVLGRQLGLRFTVSPEVKGTMTFRMEGQASDEQLLAAFEQALALNNVVMLRQSGEVVLTPRDRARTGTGVRLGAPRTGPGYGVTAVPIAYANASELSKVIQSVYGDGLVIHADDRLGLLVLAGASRDIEAVTSLIASFDRDVFEGANLVVARVQNAEPDAVAADVDRLLKAQNQTGVSLAPIGRLRSIVVVARTSALRDLAVRLIGELDRANPEGTSQLHVYRPTYAAAGDLAQVVSQLFGAGGATGDEAYRASSQTASGASEQTRAAATAAPAIATAPVTAGFNGAGEQDLRIAVDNATDSLLIWARPTRWAELRELLAQIDLPPSQVLIEATVLEVTLSDDFAFGVDFSYFEADSDLTILNTSAQSGAIAPVVPGFSIEFAGNNLELAVSTIASKSETKVVSAPKITVLQGRSANLQVGDQVPVIIQQAQNTTAPNAPIVTTTEYRDTGILLTVTPRVRGDGKVNLTLEQEVSAVARNTTSGIDSPTIQTRKFSTELLINNGSVIALGGLISETDGHGRSGIPVLSEIPVVGALFGQRTRENRRTELIILVKPTVLREEINRTLGIAEITARMERLTLDEIAASGHTPR